MKKTFQMNGRIPNKGALDFKGLLDAPAGKHGFLQAKGENLVFEDGTPLRIFGTSVVGSGCCPDHDMAEAVAERVASAGLNLVRMHYADGGLTLGENATKAALIDYSEGNSRKISEEGLERLDYFINELNKRGVYVQLDTFVGRNFQPEGDELDYPDTFPDSWAIKEVNIFNRRMVELQKEYDYNLLNHVNCYKGVRYADDPGIAVVQMMNENSLLWDFSANFNITMIPQHYLNELRGKWRLFLKEKYKTQEALRNAWTNADGICALAEIENIDYRVEIPTDSYFTDRPVGTGHKTPYNSVNSPVRTRDYIEFLVGIENDFTKEIYDFMRQDVGVKCCINTTNLIRGITNAYTASVHCDLPQHDAYYNHPCLGFAPPASCHTVPMYSRDPREAGLTASTGNLISQLANAKVAGKPLVIAEWNDTFPTIFTSEAMYMMTAYGALNGWNGMCNFMYNQEATIEHLDYDHLHFYFNIYNNPAMFGEIGVCSAAFQKGLISPARNTIDVVYTSEDLKVNNPDTLGVPYCTLPYVSRTQVVFEDCYEGSAELAISGGFTPTGDLTKAQHAIVYSESPYTDARQKTLGREKYLLRHGEKGGKSVDDVGVIGEKRAVISEAERLFATPKAYGEAVDRAMKAWGLLEKDQGFFEDRLVSDNGELCFDTGKKVFTINAVGFKAYAGDIHGPFTLGNLEFALDNARMSVSVLPLDDKAVTDSKHMLITAVGDCCNTDMERDDHWLLSLGHEPIWIDQIEGTVLVKNAPSSAKFYALQPDGAKGEELACTVCEEGVRYDFATQQGAIHFELILA